MKTEAPRTDARRSLPRQFEALVSFWNVPRVEVLVLVTESREWLESIGHRFAHRPSKHTDGLAEAKDPGWNPPNGVLPDPI